MIKTLRQTIQMEFNDDFTLTLLSNGSEKYFLDNTFTSFQNQLRQEIIFNQNKNWCVSLQDIGIHLNYENFVTNKDNPILFTFDAKELFPIIGTQIDQLKNLKFLDSNILSICTPALEQDVSSSQEQVCHRIFIESLHISPQLFNIESITKKSVGIYY